MSGAASKRFDLVVIGTGAGGATPAYRCRSQGWKVAIVDSRPFGGTCALRGCDPKKVLVGAAEVIDRVHLMKGRGLRADGTKIDWAELMRFKRSFTEPVPENREKAFARAGIETFHRPARFVAPTAVQVEADVLEGRYVVIAAGASPADLNIPGSEHVITSDRFLELDELPRRIVFIGGGYISFEFAHVATHAGAHVHILHRGPRPLAGFDPDLVDRLVERTRALGAEVHVNTQVEAIEKKNGNLSVVASTPDGSRSFEADLVVHGAGRVPEIDDLDLEAAGVERVKRGVKVNEYLQSVSNPNVYAAGDAAASNGLPLTPVAGYEGKIVADNLLGGNQRKAEYPPMPSVVFTVPPLATVGLQERAASEQGLKFKTKFGLTAGWYSSRRIGEEYSGYKVLVEEETGRILGAHLLGPHAEELINLFSLAMRTGMRAEDVREMIFAYPTHGSDMAYMV